MDLVEGINRGGFEPAAWFDFTANLRRATRGFLSDRTRAALECMTRYGLYRHPYRLLGLLERLNEDFDTTQRVYTNKGLLNLLAQESQTSLSEALELQERLDETGRTH